MKLFRTLLAALALTALGSVSAMAQSGCSYIVQGAVLTAAQWNACFQQKQNVLGYTAVNKGGDTMLGVFKTMASSASGTGFNLIPGAAPTSPNNGDMWVTAAGLYVRINGATIGPLVDGTSSPVTSVFGRTGAVVAATSDYSFSQISGSVAASQLPNPSSSTLGGVKSLAAVSHNFLTSIGTNGTPTQAQPACADISDAGSGCSSSGGGTTPPQGRLTLVTGVPVMTSDQTAKSTVYYDCYNGNTVPYYTGSAVSTLSITSCEISMGLDAVTPRISSGSLYDVFALNSSGLVICAGPAWTNSTTRSSAIHNTKGFWTNTASLTHCYGGASGTTDYGAISADQATYLGTIYATANGQTGMAFKPAPAAGGANAFLGLYNAYNRVKYESRSLDSTSTWTYATATWHVANAGGTGSGLLNRISWVDGLGQSTADAQYSVSSSTSTGIQAVVGVNFDATTGAPSGLGGQTTQTGATAEAATITGRDHLVSIGFHYAQAMEYASGATVTFTGSSIEQALYLSLEM